MDITTVENLVNTRGQIKISERNGWAAGTVGIALGYNAQYDTVRVGFVDAEGVYTGEKTTVSRSMVEEVPEAPLPFTPGVPRSVVAAALRVALKRESRLTREESMIRYIIGGALEAEGAELPPFPWERRQRENPAV